jgi:hypothetical protein
VRALAIMVCPLAEGTWTATICLGDLCSNPVSLAVTKR